MKKVAGVLIIMMALLLSASIALAGKDFDNSNTNNNNQGQNQSVDLGGQNQNSIHLDFSQHGDNIASEFPFVPGNTGFFPPNYFPGYERQVNDLKSGDILLAIDEVTPNSFKTFKRMMISERGEKFFDELEKSVIYHPDVQFTFPASERICFIAKLDGRDIRELKRVGTLTLDSKFLGKEGDFGQLAMRQDLFLFGGYQALQYGANVAIPVDAFRAYITPSGTTKGVGASVGFLQEIGSLFGISAGGQIEKSQQKTVMRGDAEVTFLLFHAENLETFLHPPRVEERPKPKVRKSVCSKEEATEISKKIATEENIFCPNLNLQNFEKHLRIAFLDIDMYACTKDKTFLRQTYKIEKTGKVYRGAIGHFRQAEKNLKYLKGERRSEAKLEMIQAYEAWTTAICIVYGRTTADRFAQDHDIRTYHTDFAQ